VVLAKRVARDLRRSRSASSTSTATGPSISSTSRCVCATPESLLPERLSSSICRSAT